MHTSDSAFNSPNDTGLNAVENEIRQLDPTGAGWGRIIRKTYDQVYNGQDTGRFKWEDLMKTEKTHFGSLFEINAQRYFKFRSGESTDFEIAGHEVDAKWSQTDGGWMLPPEVFGKIALVATGSDKESGWSLGLVRVTIDVRRSKSNRDQKSQLSSHGREAIRWLWRDAELPPNVLLQIPDNSVDLVFNPPKVAGLGSAGARRLYELFKAAEGRIVHRTTVQTVAQQLDSQKRLRKNGGARDPLRKEGYLVLSGQFESQRSIAAALGIKVPARDEYISVRLVPTSNDSGVEINGTWWRLARRGDRIVSPAPDID